MNCACGLPVVAKGFCMPCYQLARKAKPAIPCACGRRSHAKGVCSTCYKRIYPQAKQESKAALFQMPVEREAETLEETMERYKTCYYHAVTWKAMLYWHRQIRELMAEKKV